MTPVGSRPYCPSAGGQTQKTRTGYLFLGYGSRLNTDTKHRPTFKVPSTFCVRTAILITSASHCFASSQRFKTRTPAPKTNSTSADIAWSLERAKLVVFDPTRQVWVAQAPQATTNVRVVTQRGRESLFRDSKWQRVVLPSNAGEPPLWAVGSWIARIGWFIPQTHKMWYERHRWDGKR